MWCPQRDRSWTSRPRTGTQLSERPASSHARSARCSPRHPDRVMPNQPPLPDPEPTPSSPGALMTTASTNGDLYGTSFLCHAAPDNQLPEQGMPPLEAFRIIEEELVADGIPM